MADSRTYFDEKLTTVAALRIIISVGGKFQVEVEGKTRPSSSRPFRLMRVGHQPDEGIRLPLSFVRSAAVV